MTRFASLDSLLRMLVTGLILIAVFGLAHASPSAPDGHNGPMPSSGPPPADAPTPAIRLFVAAGGRPVIGPAGNTARWSGLLDGSTARGQQAVQAAGPGPGAGGPAALEPSGLEPVPRGAELEAGNGARRPHGGPAE